VPGHGILRLFSVRFILPGSPDHVIVLLPPADKKTSHAMARIAETF